MTTSYNPWPLGKLPESWVRPEIKWAKENGHFADDPREIVDKFESTIASYAGAKYGISIDCCSHGLFLALKYQLESGVINLGNELEIPSRTYASVPMQIIHAGLRPRFVDYAWEGVYEINGSEIIDSAGRFTKNMYVGSGKIQVLSFQIKKTLPIGRGGMILTDNKDAYSWLKKARHDGRDLNTPYDSVNHITQLGWHFYMTPEDAARGLYLFHQLPTLNPDSMTSQNYPLLNQWEIWDSEGVK
jgi:dTDP-4-amino-4,6-dideoxygalactose transaminase